MIRVHDCAQRTPEWFALRAGKLTASSADALYTKLRGGGEPASRRDLRTAIALEMVTGAPIETDSYLSKEMQRGIDLEPAGVTAYEADAGEIIEPAGFVERTDRAVGFSPDGLIYGAGGRIVGVLQLKCPKSATHLAYLRAGILPRDYEPQVMHELWVSGADWHDFVSFDPRMPEGLRLFRVRTTRAARSAGFEHGPSDLAFHERLVDDFLAECRVEADEIRVLMNLNRRAA